MKPRLFDKNATQANTNGLGTLDFISCKITEERNGMFELEAEISEKVLHASQLEMCSIILAQVPDQTDLQQFRVYKITKPISGIQTIFAQHISYQLSLIPTMPFQIVGDATACAQSLAGLKSHAVESCPFDFNTDVTTVASFGFQKPISIRNALGGVKGSILDRFGGEYLWNNYTVNLKKNRGRTPEQKNVTLRYGKNITDLNQEENISDTITGVVPFWMNTDGTMLVTLPEYKVESQYADRYPFKRTVPLDMSSDFENEPTQAELRTAAQAYVNQSGLGVPEVSIKVSFISLDKDTQTALQKVKLCDVIGVEFEKLQISTTAKVVKYIYDVLAEKYISIEIGSIRPSLAQTISNTNGAITTTLDKAINATKGATAWLTGSHGYVMAVKNSDGSWKELLFLDTNDAATAHNVLRINENGIGFSSNGVDGPYSQAWTLDGKLVIGGTNVPSITVYDSQNNIIFQASRDGMIWNAANSTMSASGVLTASGASLTNATINGGSLTVKDDQNNVVFQTNKNGTVWNSTNSQMSAQGVLTANGAQLSNASIKGGDLLQKNNGVYIQIMNGNIHGGTYQGDYLNNEQILYMSFTVNGNRCLTMSSSGGLCFQAPRHYVRDGQYGNVYECYDGDVVTNVNTESVTIMDYYGNPVTFQAVSSQDKKGVVHGMVKD